MIKKIATDGPPGVQAGLDALAQTPEFTQVLQEEVTARNLVLEDVTPCISSIYYHASKRAPGNDPIITIYTEDHSMEQRAVLAAFLRIQRRWPHGLGWREAKRIR